MQRVRPNMLRRPSVARSAFRAVAVAEALTWAGLLVGMLFKYVLAEDERGVQVFGPLHGAMFIAYVVAVLVARRSFTWSPRLTFVALVCSVPPFASLLFEVWADKTGRLTTGAPTEEVLPRGEHARQDAH